jgi:hypothetical protein
MDAPKLCLQPPADRTRQFGDSEDSCCAAEEIGPQGWERKELKC